MCVDCDDDTIILYIFQVPFLHHICFMFSQNVFSTVELSGGKKCEVILAFWSLLIKIICWLWDRIPHLKALCTAEWKPMTKQRKLVQTQVKDLRAIEALRVYFTVLNRLYWESTTGEEASQLPCRIPQSLSSSLKEDWTVHKWAQCNNGRESTAAFGTSKRPWQ